MKKYRSSNNSSGGVSISMVVQIVLIILKLVGVIGWPQMTVLVPLWIELGLVLIAVAIFLVNDLFDKD